MLSGWDLTTSEWTIPCYDGTRHGVAKRRKTGYSIKRRYTLFVRWMVLFFIYLFYLVDQIDMSISLAI